MAVEAIDYSSEEEFHQALQQEAYENQQEPDVVPCFGCGCQMYEENKEPKYTFCQKCKDIINGVKEETEEKKSFCSDLPF